jgi:uncharacterized protein involved in outer membrane biogenesis
MSAWRIPRTRMGKILSAATLGLALLSVLFVALLAAADAGLLDRAIQRWASRKIDRPVNFRALHLHLLSPNPRVQVEGLSIANPAWMGRGAVAEAARLTATFSLARMIRGGLGPSTLAIEGLELHLLKVSASKNSWTFGKARKLQRGFDFLRPVERLTIADGHVDFVDIQRKLRFRAIVTHGVSGAMPLLIRGQGRLDGIPLGLTARGGPLHGVGVERPYPFVAHLVDGATIVDAKGTSANPFDLVKFRLAIRARGPNLADLGYLFNLRTPNSAPFTLATIAEGDGAQFAFRPLQVRFGGSDVRGWIRSDHTTGRHRATAELWSAVWTNADVRAVLAPIPPRAVARSASGAVPRDVQSRWILPETPFPIANLRGVDLQAHVHVRAVRGYPLPLDELSARIDLDNGKLTYSAVRAEIYGGSLSGSAVLDVHRPTPRLTIAGAVRGVQLSQVPARSAARMSGELTLTAKLSGAGRSVHEAASTASGAATVRIRHGSVPPAAAFMLGGDMLKALHSMGDVQRPIALDCVSARFGATGGRLTTDNLVIKTAAGDTIGRGLLDLRDERVSFTLEGAPKHHKPFQLAMPILIQGPAKRPGVSVLPAHNAAKLGLKGKLGVVMSPLAALLPLGEQASVVARCN